MHEELVQALGDGRPRLAQARAVLLPDLYVDHLVPLADRDTLDAGIDRLVDQGGGNLVTPRQRVVLGGNAANTVLALASLGVPATLIARTDGVGRTLFEQAARGLPAPARGLRHTDHPSSTVALELAGEGANVMLSDPGPLADLGPGDLDEDAWTAIDQADVVGVANWAQTLAHGTELVDQVVSRAHRAGAFTFLDTADPAHRGDDVHDLLASPAVQEDLSAWGMNEHEARWFAGALTDRDPGHLGLEDAARVLDEHVHARIDVHTADGAFSLADGDLERAATFEAEPTRRTGAGDAWNAGNLAGQLLDLPAGQRLTLANAVAVLAITGQDPGPPGLDQVQAFLATT